MPTNDTMWLFMRKRNSKGSHKARTECCCTYCGARSEHDNGTCRDTTQYGDEEETCVVEQAAATHRSATVRRPRPRLRPKPRARGRRGAPEGGKSPQGVQVASGGHTLVELAEFWNNMERV